MFALMFAAFVCVAAFAAAAEWLTERPVPGRVYGYVRVSTDKQAANPEVQRKAIEQAALNIGRTVDAWFQDAPAQNPDGSWNDAQSGKVPISERKAGREMTPGSARGTW